MIAFPNDLPFIRLGNGEVVPFEADWLAQSLSGAARKAGLNKWWLASHVTASVTEYLRTDNEAPVIEAERLEQAVRSVLQCIGYAEVSQHFQVGQPLLNISLIELARQAGTGYELAFFELLARRLAEAFASRTPHFRLIGLHSCVKLLRARKIWSRDCDQLEAEIVLFTRQHTGTAVAQHDVSFSLI
ncbi:MAG TPA: hypothetical protein VFG14_01665 [Chthoniobacteraceae bacterium]|jgi:hypothetical protein|nr:hypothetical protein [Chthoniobacteraceae bacterium]